MISRLRLLLCFHASSVSSNAISLIRILTNDKETERIFMTGLSAYLIHSLSPNFGIVFRIILHFHRFVNYIRRDEFEQLFALLVKYMGFHDRDSLSAYSLIKSLLDFGEIRPFFEEVITKSDAANRVLTLCLDPKFEENHIFQLLEILRCILTKYSSSVKYNMDFVNQLVSLWRNSTFQWSIGPLCECTFHLLKTLDGHLIQQSGFISCILNSQTQGEGQDLLTDWILRLFQHYRDSSAVLFQHLLDSNILKYLLDFLIVKISEPEKYLSGKFVFSLIGVPMGAIKAVGVIINHDSKYLRQFKRYSMHPLLKELILGKVFGSNEMKDHSSKRGRQGEKSAPSRKRQK